MNAESRHANVLLATALATFLLTFGMLLEVPVVQAQSQCQEWGAQVGLFCMEHWDDVGEGDPPPQPNWSSCAHCAFDHCFTIMPNYTCFGECTGAATNVGCT